MATVALADRAFEVGTAVAAAALGTPARLQIEGSAQGWQATLHRQIFEQTMSVWKIVSLVDVIQDPHGRVIGYVDHEAYRGAGDRPTLDSDQLRALVLDEETLPPHARVVSQDVYPGPEGGHLLAATVEAVARGGLRRWLVEINVARLMIAAVRPLDFVVEE